MLAQLYPPVIGGEERHVRNLSRALAARGHEVHVATLDAGETPEHDDGVTVHLLDHVGRRVPGLYPTADRPLALPLPDPVVTRGLARLATRVRPDLVHAHNWIVNSWVVLPAARRLPLVLSMHDYGHVCATKRLVRRGALCEGPAPQRCLPCTTDHYGRGRGPAVYAAVRAGRPVREKVADLVTPVSRYVAESNGLPGRVPHEVVPNFVPDALTTLAAQPRDGLPTGPYFFFAGDLSDQKGVGTLLEAHRRLAPATRPALVLAGRPVDPLGAVDDDVHVGHHWPHARVLAGFQHALAAALPSEWPDPCPTTVLEALAVGSPLVTTGRGGIADMVVDGDSALVVPPADAPALSHALHRLASDAGLREQLAAGARGQVRGFLESAVAQRLERLYGELLDARPARSPGT